MLLSKKQLFFFYSFGLMLAYLSRGVYQLDEYFQVIEWSRWILGLPYTQAWEATQSLRHPALAYFYAGILKVLFTLKITDPQVLIEILRSLSFLFNASLQLWCAAQLSARLFPNDQSKLPRFFIYAFALYYLWARTNSENFATTFLFASLTFALVPLKKIKISYFLSGLCTVLAFAMRFPIAAAFLGHVYILYTLIQNRSWHQLCSMLSGLLAGITLFALVEFEFYGSYFLSPIQFFNFNVLGAAGETFGKEIGLSFFIFLVLFAFPLNFLLVKKFICKQVPFSFRTQEDQRILLPFLISISSFFLVHMMIAHKEARFLFPLIPLLVVLLGYFITGLKISKLSYGIALSFQACLLVYHLGHNLISERALQLACQPYAIKKTSQQYMIWAETGWFSFHTFPSFFCGEEIEVLQNHHPILVENMSDLKELRENLVKNISLQPPAQARKVPRYLRKDGWTRSFENRIKDTLEKDLIIFLERRSSELKSDLPCSIEKIKRPGENFWINLIPFHLRKKLGDFQYFAMVCKSPKK